MGWLLPSHQKKTFNNTFEPSFEVFLQFHPPVFVPFEIKYRWCENLLSFTFIWILSSCYIWQVIFNNQLLYLVTNGSTFASLTLSSSNKTDLGKLSSLPETKKLSKLNNLGNLYKSFFLSFTICVAKQQETFEEGSPMISQHIWPTWKKGKISCSMWIMLVEEQEISTKLFHQGGWLRLGEDWGSNQISSLLPHPFSPRWLLNYIVWNIMIEYFMIQGETY